MSAAVLAAQGAWAQEAFPSKALRIIVPQPPGGGFDSVARILSDKLFKALGQPVIVENRAGSGTVVGTDLAAKATPDGYSLLMGSVSNLALNMGLYKSLPYNSLRDFEPVGLAVSYGYVLMARKDLPLKSLPDVFAFAKANPGKLTYASAGNGSGQHVLAAALWKTAKIDVTHIPYRGAQPAYQDLLGGRVDLFFDIWSTARAHIESNGVVPLAVSSATRIPNIPSVPTLLESDIKVELESWFGLFTQTKTPQKIKDRLRAEVARVIASREVSDTFRKSGGRSLSLSPTEALALVRRDVDRWSKTVRDLAIALD